MKKKLIIVAVLIVAVTVPFLLYKKKANGEEYKKVKVTVGDLKVTILSTGTVEPENRLEIKAPVAGRVESVLVKEGQKVKRGQVLAMISSTERAALIDAARARGEEERKKWEDYYKAIPIYAPISGTIILRNVEPGQSFTSSDAILVMSDRLTVKAQVDETDIAKVKVGQSAEIILDAYSDKVIPAGVDKIAYDAKTVNNVTTYIVDVLPVNTPDFMLSGMTANVTFSVDSRKAVLLLPTEAIRNKDDHFYVFLAGKNGKPVETNVNTGASDGKNIQVVSGVSEGDTVLIPVAKKNNSSKTNNPFSPFRRRNK